MSKSVSPTPPAAEMGGGAKSKPFPFPTTDNHPPQPEQPSPPVVGDPSEEAIDRGIEESFPASDPVSVTVTKAVQLPDPDKAHAH